MSWTPRERREYYRQLDREFGKDVRRAEGERLRQAEQTRAGYIKCRTCDGTGLPSVTARISQEPRCPVCEGTGRVPPNWYTSRGL